MLNRKQCIASDFESKENANAKLGQVDLSKVAKTFPYMEYYTDSRNLEMATTVAQAILLMRKP
jgi:ABC-type branched-subunit amino acid transport system ATPase component